MLTIFWFTSISYHSINEVKTSLGKWTGQINAIREAHGPKLAGILLDA